MRRFHRHPYKNELSIKCQKYKIPQNPLHRFGSYFSEM